MNRQPFNVLFVCAANSVRSIMAEAILNQVSMGRFNAGSAGFVETGLVHPLTIEQMKRSRLDVSKLRSKDWREFAGGEPLDFVITFDPLPADAVPAWPGEPIVAFWNIDDPARFEGSEQDKRRAFMLCFQLLNRRISLFASLPLERLDRSELKRRLEDIGGQPQSA